MCPRSWLLVWVAVSASALAGDDNLLKNADFSLGMKEWWAGQDRSVRDAGYRQSVKNGKFIADIPAGSWAPWNAQLGQQIRLEAGKTYRLSLTLETSHPGIIRLVYNIRVKPYSSLGIAANIRVNPGEHPYSEAFTARKAAAGVPTTITIGLGGLKGKVALSGVELQEIVRMPLSLAKAWRVFLGVVAPQSYSSEPRTLQAPDGRAVAAKTVKLKRNTLDLAALNGGKFHTRDVAILYNEFEVGKRGVMRLGAAADWWMEIYVNGTPIYSTMDKGNGSSKYTPDDHSVECPVEPGRNLLAVKVLSGSRGWRFVCGVPRPDLRFQVDSEWKAVEMSDVQVKAGSALDLSSLSAPPSWARASSPKRLPRLTIGDGGRLVAEGRPDAPLKLRGYTFNGRWAFRASHEDIDKAVRLSRTLGYNLFRFYNVDALSPNKDMSIEPELLDKVDYLINQMEKQGVYMHMTLFAYSLYMKRAGDLFQRRNEYKIRMYLGDPLFRDAWQYGTQTLMNHVNPYTGRAWKDEPVIACVEFYNEQRLGLTKVGSMPPQTRAAFNARFRRWLEARYKTTQGLAKAWGDASITSFEQVEVPKTLHGKGPKANDFLLLCSDLARENAEWCETALRRTGYKGLTAQYNFVTGQGDVEVRFEKSQVAIINKYFNHPSDQSNPGSKCRQNSSVGAAASYWRSMNATRFADRPLLVTEFNHAFWNQYQHECGLVFGAFSALQGIDAMVVHASAAPLEVTARNNAWSVGSSPVARASEFLSGCLFLRRDVRSSPRRIELQIPQAYLESDCRSAKAVSTEQSKIGLMCGFTVAFPWAKRPPGVATPGKPNLVIAPSAGADVKTRDWFVEVVNSKDAEFSLDAFVAGMKEKGLLPTSNISKPSEGIFQSDTGEITMRTRENLLKVVTPRTEAVTLEAGKGEPLGKLNIVSTSTPALVATCAVDGRALADSRRIVLLYSTEIANTDMQLSADRVTLKHLGRLPVLMRVGTLDATLANSNGAAMALYALGFDGSRRERLPLKAANGVLGIKLDTATLKNGPTPFFELVRQ